MKKIILNESQEKALIRLMLKPKNLHDKRYPVHPEKVLLIKKFLDGGYKKGKGQEIGPEGLPVLIPCFGMLDATKQMVIRNIMQDEMLDLLKSQFGDIYPEEDHRDRFLDRVMKDWYEDHISPEGLLSVNFV